MDATLKTVIRGRLMELPGTVAGVRATMEAGHAEEFDRTVEDVPVRGSRPPGGPGTARHQGGRGERRALRAPGLWRGHRRDRGAPWISWRPDNSPAPAPLWSARAADSAAAQDQRRPEPWRRHDDRGGDLLIDAA